MTQSKIASTAEELDIALSWVADKVNEMKHYMNVLSAKETRMENVLTESREAQRDIKIIRDRLEAANNFINEGRSAQDNLDGQMRAAESRWDNRLRVLEDQMMKHLSNHGAGLS